MHGTIISALLLINVSWVLGIPVEEYACPLSSTASSLSSSSNKHCSSSRNVYHGLAHTYIRIGDQCYDWGNWNYVRSLSCTDERLACCTSISSRKHSENTNCPSLITTFNRLWEKNRGTYHLISNNCQEYTHRVLEVLKTCLDPQTYFG